MDPDFCPCCPGVLLYGDPCPFCGDDCPDCQSVNTEAWVAHVAKAMAEELVTCAWCPNAEPSSLDVSHGICKPCEARVNAELDADDVRDNSGRLVAPPQSALPVRVTMAYPMREGM